MANPSHQMAPMREHRMVATAGMHCRGAQGRHGEHRERAQGQEREAGRAHSLTATHGLTMANTVNRLMMQPMAPAAYA